MSDAPTMRHDMWRTLADSQGMVSGVALAQAAARCGIPLREAEAQTCEAGCMPARYARNGADVSSAGQARLLRATVLLVGLGGLGGWLLEMLARTGVGHIIGVDGDCFEESNCNRQLLATQATLGQGKAAAAAARVALVNPATLFEPVDAVLHGDAFAPLASRADVVADALGGLQDRAALYAAAEQAGKTVVVAGIAGGNGWVAVARPGEANPVHALFCGGTRGKSVEETLGNPVHAVAMAAALQCAEIVKLITSFDTACTREKSPVKGLRGMMLFDIDDNTLSKVTG